MNTDNILEISFDELSETRRFMRYNIVHCNADWQPDGLPDQMVLDGFNEGFVENYNFSNATTAHYVNYKIILPNDKIRFKISGNYLLKVYDESNPEDVLLQVRFMVCEASVPVSGAVTTQTDVDYNRSNQQLNVAVDIKKASVVDPYRDLKVVAYQNSRSDSRRVFSAPLRIVDGVLYYEHNPSLIFPAGNEYRRFETVSVNYPGMHVDKMEFFTPYYHASLIVDEPRSITGYAYDSTQKGRYRIRVYDSDYSDVDADYILTHFTLVAPELQGREIYVEGDLSNRDYNSSNRMVFNRETGAYECAMLLKQGSYNYQYVVRDPVSGKCYTAPVEGDFYQTQNEYTVLVYHHRPGELFDRLVGFANFNSFY